MNKLNICIDIDGTITNPYCWVDVANWYFGCNVTEDDVNQYEIHKVLNVKRQEYNEFYNIFGEFIHLKANIRKEAKRVIHQLNRKHNISYVTAREQKMKDVSIEWFKMNGLPTDNLYLLGSHYKVEKAKELNCDIFIEDRYENAVQLALAGFKVLLIDCNYNRMPNTEGIIRVSDWNQINDEIDKYYVLVKNKKVNSSIQEIA